MLSNYITTVKGRVGSNKDISVDERNTLVQAAEKRLSQDFEYYHWDADIHGIIVRLYTNSAHLHDFWVENWYPAPSSRYLLPHAIIYAVKGIEGHEPYAYYNHETKTAVFINTEYYGQCKSWALGAAADILELEHGIHSVHGSCAIVDGKGVLLIAPTGTGKSTHTWGLIEQPGSKIHSDDWVFLRYSSGRAIADISERKFYLRTDIVANYPRMHEYLERCKCENVPDSDFLAFGNSRAILDPEWLGRPGKFVETTEIKSVILLRRDDQSPPEVSLEPEEAIMVLEEGRYQVLAGAGADIGAYGQESFYNPYLLVKRPQLQKKFFGELFKAAPCHILNTGVEPVKATQERIRRIVLE